MKDLLQHSEFPLLRKLSGDVAFHGMFANNPNKTPTTRNGSFGRPSTRNDCTAHPDYLTIVECWNVGKVPRECTSTKRPSTINDSVYDTQRGRRQTNDQTNTRTGTGSLRCTESRHDPVGLT